MEREQKNQGNKGRTTLQTTTIWVDLYNTTIESLQFRNFGFKEKR